MAPCRSVMDNFGTRGKGLREDNILAFTLKKTTEVSWQSMPKPAKTHETHDFDLSLSIWVLSCSSLSSGLSLVNGQAFQSCHLQSWNPQLDLVADEAGFPRRSGFDWPSDIVAICHKLPQISSTFSGLPTFVNNRSIYFFLNLL